MTERPQRRLALTGGIACGKSLFAACLNRHGVETADADDIVHALVPEDERRRLAAEVFADPSKRAALEARLHPLVKRALAERAVAAAAQGKILVEVIPLLYEAHWEKDYDFVIALVSSRENQLSRMMRTRGYSREEAEARIAAQMPVAEKAARADCVVENNGDEASLAEQAERLAERLKAEEKKDVQTVA